MRKTGYEVYVGNGVLLQFREGAVRLIHETGRLARQAFRGKAPVVVELPKVGKAITWRESEVDLVECLLAVKPVEDAVSRMWKDVEVKVIGSALEVKEARKRYYSLKPPKSVFDTLEKIELSLRRLEQCVGSHDGFTRELEHLDSINVTDVREHVCSTEGRLFGGYYYAPMTAVSMFRGMLDGIDDFTKKVSAGEMPDPYMTFYADVRIKARTGPLVASVYGVGGYDAPASEFKFSLPDES